MLRKTKTPYLRDVYLAYLIDGARRTETDEFPIIEEWMVATEPPKEIIQWDRRYDVKNPSNTAICFYCSDPGFQPILGNPQRYLNKMKQYQCVVGLDASPYDNMPLVVQKSQIYLNLGITYYYGSLGIKVIPNVRLGDNRTLSSLEAYPRHTLIAIGTHGFTKRLDNRYIFANQVINVVDKLEPSGICVYGPASDEIFGYARLKGIPIYQYDSYTMKENAKDKKRKLSEEDHNEGRNSLFGGKMRSASGNISFMPKSGKKGDFAKFIANRSDIDPNGMYDVIAHGNWKEIEVSSGGRDLRVDSRQAAKLIKKQPNFKKAKAVRLLSCNTGSHPEGFAQHLANALGKPVYAPNMTIYTYPNGTHWISDNGKRGDFVKFVPGGVKHGRK